MALHPVIVEVARAVAADESQIDGEDKLRELIDMTQQLSDDDFHALSDEAQCWVNACCEAILAGRRLPTVEEALDAAGIVGDEDYAVDVDELERYYGSTLHKYKDKQPQRIDSSANIKALDAILTGGVEPRESPVAKAFVEGRLGKYAQGSTGQRDILGDHNSPHFIGDKRKARRVKLARGGRKAVNKRSKGAARDLLMYHVMKVVHEEGDDKPAAYYQQRVHDITGVWPSVSTIWMARCGYRAAKLLFEEVIHRERAECSEDGTEDDSA